MSKGARFDVYVKDGSGRCFDIEIQTSHLIDLAKRARYYQGVMDVDNLMAGEDYKDLKDSYVIFLCLGAPFAQGLSQGKEEKALETAKNYKNRPSLNYPQSTVN